jgi:crotonobetainyl-CoA:carnitine CoA-transferase CaiB-like acyl-CoA transferase
VRLPLDLYGCMGPGGVNPAGMINMTIVISSQRERPAMGGGVELDCLGGIRVVDFTQFEAGPSCTESLAWLGAEVVKIENPRTGDPGRRLQPGKPDNDPWYFHQFNANKKSVTLNLKSARGLEIVRALLKKADVTIENMAPGTIERLGLGYDEVKKINPGIIYCQVKGFGAGSPYEKSLAFDMIAQAAGGTFSVTGEGDRAPVKPGPSLGDTGTGMLMAISVLGALYKRSKTGQGRLLQVAMQDAMLHYMRVPFSRTQLTGQAVMRDGSSRSTPGGLTPRALYPCKPGGPNDYVYVFCSRANPEHWQRLLRVIGREDLCGDERYDTQQARSQRAAEVDEIITAWTRQHTKEEAMKLIGAASVPAGAVFDTLELMNDPSFSERGIMQTIDHPTTGKVKMPSWPVRFDGTPPKVKPSPQLGQHVDDVLGSWLGMGAKELAALGEEGIV